MTNRYLILTAQVISVVFSPFYLPVVAFVVLLFFSYMSYTSWQYNAQVIGMVALFTVILPKLAIYAYRKINGWTRHQLSRRERRIVPYILSISSYTTLLYMMDHMRMPRFTLGIVAGALAIQIVCALINPWLKVSTHAAASGGVIGAVMAFSLILNFDPTNALCLAVLLSGLVCTARMILRQHKLTDLGLGVLIGMACALFFILNI
ncbi:MAG: hypothetical protein EGR33_00800 [Prevotella sp.]|jgi:PAP2 superfamily domain protein|uniref:hypothetical protein n=1 Tax=Alloprevotella sp. TaxID=1872471 RepID=UPI001EBC94CA|nr:hypothetical protein [Prevotella sp.]